MNVPYQIIKSDRKTIAIQIKPDGQVVVRCPKRMRIEEARRFAESKADWIQKHLAKRLPQDVAKYTPKEIEQLREQARKLVTERVRYYAPIIGVTYGQIAIRTQHIRWAAAVVKVISISISIAYLLLYRLRYWTMLLCMNYATERN